MNKSIYIEMEGQADTLICKEWIISMEMRNPGSKFWNRAPVHPTFCRCWKRAQVRWLSEPVHCCIVLLQRALKCQFNVLLLAVIKSYELFLRARGKPRSWRLHWTGLRWVWLFSSSFSDLCWRL